MSKYFTYNNTDKFYTSFLFFYLAVVFRHFTSIVPITYSFSPLTLADDRLPYNINSTASFLSSPFLPLRSPPRPHHPKKFTYKTKQKTRQNHQKKKIPRITRPTKPRATTDRPPRPPAPPPPARCAPSHSPTPAHAAAAAAQPHGQHRILHGQRRGRRGAARERRRAAARRQGRPPGADAGQSSWWRDGEERRRRRGGWVEEAGVVLGGGGGGGPAAAPGGGGVRVRAAAVHGRGVHHPHGAARRAAGRPRLRRHRRAPRRDRRPPMAQLAPRRAQHGEYQSRFNEPAAPLHIAVNFLFFSFISVVFCFSLGSVLASTNSCHYAQCRKATVNLTRQTLDSTNGLLSRLIRPVRNRLLFDQVKYSE